jgi:gas vesicle protein
MTRPNHGDINAIAAFAAGGLIGAGVALLWATHTGSEVRRSLIHPGAGRRLNSFRSKIQEEKDEIREVIQAGKEDIEKEVEDDPHIRGSD